MSKPAILDVTGIGNAIVDIIARTDDAFLARHAIAKGGMTLIDAAAANQLYGAMGPGIEKSGGSAANTIAGVAALGGRAAFIGKVQQDQLGEVFAHDLRAMGVRYDTPASTSENPTGRCLILVTPDAQRSLSTFLGRGRNCGLRTSIRQSSRRRRSLIWKAICGTRPMPRRRFARPWKSPMAPDARLP